MPPDRRTWLVSLFFGMGSSPTGALVESLAVGLHQRGDPVEVLAGRSAYNAAAVGDKPRFAGTVHRLWSGPANPTGLKGRLFSWAAYYLSVCAFIFTRRLPPRVVLVTTPPFLLAAFAVRNALARRPARLVLWNQDTYPEVLAAVGLLKPRSLSYRALLALQKFATRRADQAVALDRAMARILQGHGARRVAIVPNWEMPREGDDAPPPEDIARRIAEARYGWRYLVLYTGNYGWGHDLSSLFDTLRQHPEQRDFFFLFVGGGEKWADLVRLRDSGTLPCLAIFPYVPKACLPAVLQAADFGLVALEQSCVGLMSPSKIHAYLAQGKPLLYLGPPGSNVADAIDQYGCGLRVDERDAAGLARALAALADGSFDHATARAAALRASAERYTEAVGLRDLLGRIDDTGRPG